MIAALCPMKIEAGSSAYEFGKGLVYLRCEIVILEQKNPQTYSKEVHLELPGSIKCPFESFGYECKVRAFGKFLSFSLVTPSCQGAGAEEMADGGA